MSKTAPEIHTNNIVLGSGELFIDVLDADSAPTGERYVGDAVSATLSVTSERTQIYSGTGEVAQVLADELTQITRTMGLTLHDTTLENFALFVGGTTSEVAANTTAVVNEKIAVKHGHWYQLGRTAQNPRGAGAVTESTVAVATEKNANSLANANNESFEVDASRGRVYIQPNATGIADDSSIYVDYTPAAKKRQQAKSYTIPQATLVAVRYLESAKRGAQGRDIYAGKCSLAASGEMQLMSRSAEQQIPLTAAIQEPGGGAPALVIDGESVG